jgi:hypothetical protein
VKTNNPLERIIREIRRRTRVHSGRTFSVDDGRSAIATYCEYEVGQAALPGDGNAAQPRFLRRQPLEIGSGYRQRKCERLLTQPPGRTRRPCLPPRRAWSSSVGGARGRRLVAAGIRSCG